MLKIEFKDNRQDPIWVMEKGLSIGRSEKNQLVIDAPTVSFQHAKITFNGEGYLIKDLGSEHGTYVNGKRVTHKPLFCDDLITIGGVQLQVVDPTRDAAKDKGKIYWSLIADSSWLSGQEFPMFGELGQRFSVGRGAQCDIIFAGTHLSRKHAEFTVGSDKLLVTDLGSANGIFVNDEKVETATLYPGDRVRLDVYSFRVFGPGIEPPRSSKEVFAATPIEKPPVSDASTASKQWKSKPTSPGNREELNLYQKHHGQLIIAGLLLAGVISVVAYIGLGLLGN